MPFVKLFVRELFNTVQPVAARVASIWPCERAFLAIAVLSALFLIPLIPPYQCFDEDAHFFRAYQTQQLKFLAETEGIYSGAELPISLRNMMGEQWRSMAYGAHPPSKATLDGILSGFRHELVPEETDFVDFSNTARYLFLLYVPQATGIWIAKLFDLPPLALMYAARIGNAITAIALLWIGLRLTRFGRIAVFCVASLPQTQYLIACTGPDATALAWACIFFALMTRVMYGSANSTIRIWEGAAAAIISAAKIVYLPLVFAGAWLAWNRRRNRISQFTIAGVACVITVLWIFIADVLTSRLWPYGDAATLAQQITYFTQNPLQIPLILMRTLVDQVPYWGLQIIGTFGMPGNSVLLPLAVYPVLCLCLIMAFLAQEADVSMSTLERLGILVICASVFLAILLGIYGSFNKVGAPVVLGVQGRYFLPMLPLIAAIVPRVHFFYKRLEVTYCGILFILIGSTLILIWSVVTGFYEFT